MDDRSSRAEAIETAPDNSYIAVACHPVSRSCGIHGLVACPGRAQPAVLTPCRHERENLTRAYHLVARRQSVTHQCATAISAVWGTGVTRRIGSNGARVAARPARSKSWIAVGAKRAPAWSASFTYAAACSMGAGRFGPTVDESGRGAPAADPAPRLAPARRDRPVARQRRNRRTMTMITKMSTMVPMPIYMASLCP